MPDVFRHEALAYHGTDDFAVACVDVLRDGLAHEDRLIVLAASDKLAAVADQLGADASDVAFVALDEQGRNPSRIANLLNTFQIGSGGRHCVGVSEPVIAGRTPAGLAEAQLSEFLFSTGHIASWPLTLVCLYDTDSLQPAVLDVMRQSHAVMRGQHDNPDYLPDQAAVLLATDLDAAPHTAWRLDVGAGDLAELREFVRANATRAGLGDDRRDDLVLAANEIVTNSVRYGGGHAQVAMWLEDLAVMCEVRDAGHVTDPLIGRFAPTPAASSGRGIWLANHLCDLVQFRSSATGTTVRLLIDR